MPAAVSLKTVSRANTTNTCVQLLDNFEYYGEWMPSYATTMNYGSFTQLKTVNQSGSGIYCDTKRSGGTVWQQCCCGLNSFEAMKNGGYIVSQSNWHTLPSNCYASGSTEIICNANFDISSGDTILATWYEPSRSISLHDNGGSIQADLYGYGTATDPTVCFGARDNSYGSFYVSTAISVSNVLMTYSSGNVYNSGGQEVTKWGNSAWFGVV
ncbi:unnamed protein product [Prorocentrum cordatum]|uniref:Altered inheritance of mitochondria protein 24, mitochondrial n=1 Tax=Prorocentrum cordatum TaxID=2364126 RepID=A0ABN9U3A9_9DINO|nr:unnamed protein product [Polarella glacialis]